MFLLDALDGGLRVAEVLHVELAVLVTDGMCNYKKDRVREREKGKEGERERSEIEGKKDRKEDKWEIVRERK